MSVPPDPEQQQSLRLFMANEAVVRSGWSLKSLHKKIAHSATYLQGPSDNAAAGTRDADSRLVWRFPPRHLTAANIRDTILAVSGRLDLSMYGSGFNLFNQRGGVSGFKPVESFAGSGLHRMVYAPHGAAGTRGGVRGVRLSGRRASLTNRLPR